MHLLYNDQSKSRTFIPAKHRRQTDGDREEPAQGDDALRPRPCHQAVVPVESSRAQ